MSKYSTYIGIKDGLLALRNSKHILPSSSNPLLLVTLNQAIPARQSLCHDHMAQRITLEIHVFIDFGASCKQIETYITPGRG
jgi:hypothetical protein